MFFVDVRKLIGKIAERGFTLTSFAVAIGVTRPTLAKYLKDYSRMTYSIIDRMVSVLNLESTEAIEIFFAQQLTCDV